MSWSGTKKKLNTYICNSLRFRVDFHKTIYKKSHDKAGRAWITLDKKEIWSSNDFEYFENQNEFYKLKNNDFEKGRTDSEDLFLDSIEYSNNQGIYHTDHFEHVIEQYIHTLSFEAALKSDEFLINFITVIDKRLGKRRFKAMNIPNIDSIQTIYRLRKKLENW